jgi:hypothetical protein
MLDLTSKAMLAASIRVGMFAKRDTIEQALDYATEIIERLYNDDKAAMYTALHVVLNTVADKISELPDELPAPPTEVLVNSDGLQMADYPATGAPSLHDQIEEIVLAQISRLGDTIDRKIEKTIEEWSENAPFDAIIEEWFNDNVDIETNVKEYLDENLDETVREVLVLLDLKVRITN